jgi:hypothetical protein
MEQNLVPLAPLRDAFHASGLTISEFARRMGYMRMVPNIDIARRALGLRPDTDSRTGDRKCPRRFCSWRQAKRIADALGVDYHDVGL